MDPARQLSRLRAHDLREAMQRTSDYVAAQPTQNNVTRLRPAAGVGR
jgi:hypothetical protein